MNFLQTRQILSGLTQLAQGEEDFFHHLALDK
jgi:hypothetical protein